MVSLEEWKCCCIIKTNSILIVNPSMAVSLASNDLYGGVVIVGFVMALEYFFTMEITCTINRKRHFSK